MTDSQSLRVYDVKIAELFGIAAFVGCGHYASSLIQDFNAASGLAGVLASADVGITAAAGVVAYSAYRYFRPRNS